MEAKEFMKQKAEDMSVRELEVAMRIKRRQTEFKKKPSLSDKGVTFKQITESVFEGLRNNKIRFKLSKEQVEMLKKDGDCKVFDEEEVKEKNHPVSFRIEGRSGHVFEEHFHLSKEEIIKMIEFLKRRLTKK